MKNYLHEKPKYKSDQEKILQALQAQLIELHKNGGHEKNIEIKCACCEKSFYISVLFRCYHCGLWFCATCSKPHFGDKPSYIYNLPDESDSDKGGEI